MIGLFGLAWAGTWELVAARRDDMGYTVPAAEQRAAYAALVRDLARAAPAGPLPADASARAAALDLELVREGDRVWLLERVGATRGAGVLAIRTGPLAHELVVQAPHPTSDLHTGQIVGALFDAGGIRAACFATTHRWAVARSDVAREPSTWFQSATDGLADALLDPLFVQVHGFGEASTVADAVVSEGAARIAPAELTLAVRRLAVGLDATDVRTGDEVPALAARGNVQGRLLADRARFLHVELSFVLRDGLRADDARRRAFVDALLLLAAREAVVP